MSNAVTFMTSYTANIQQVVQLLQTLQLQNLQMSDDSTLVTRYFQGANARTDIVAADVTNASSAVAQLLFTFNSGTPTQASYMLKVMP